MTKIRSAFIILNAFFEIVRYESILRVWGIGRILAQLSRQGISQKEFTGELEQDICNAVLLASCFHWKPVLCLQRSVCTARLLRKYGINAHVVIGYRPSPFFSHAWVEVEDRVVYGSPAYKRQLLPLFVSQPTGEKA